MKPILIIAALLVAVGLAVWLFGGGSAPAPARTAGASSSSSSSTGLVDGLTVQLDAKTKAVGLQVTAIINDLKQTLARDPIDGEAARAQLRSYDDLAGQVAGAREELATRGSSAAEIDAWLTRYHWAEAQELAKSLRDKVAAAP